MSQGPDNTIPKDKFLTIVTNLLHRVFVQAGRTDAKKLFRLLEEGRNVQLTTVEMEDKSTVRFFLSLDQEQFPGRLNYGAFRVGVATLIGNLAGFLKDKQNIPVFNSAQQDGAMIFGVTAITMEGNTPSVMVLGANTASKDGSVKLQLMYLDHQQFIEQQAADTVTAPGSVGG